MSFQQFNASNLFSVKGKTAIVTGAGSGIGKGIATALVVNGAKVIICGRRIEPIEKAAEEINAAAKENGNGGEVIAVQADVATKQGVIDFHDKAVQYIDKLDFLVNNAGFSANWKDLSPPGEKSTLAKKLFSIEDEDWANMTAIHCAGPYYLAVKFIPLFEKSDNPSVCNITSLAATFLQRACCEYSYAQSKAAEQQLTLLMAAALQEFGIRVNSVAPGLFPSGLTLDAEEKFYGPMQEAIDTAIPPHRAGKIEEIAGQVLVLATAAGAYTNGADIVVDGGWKLNASARDV